MAGNRFCTALQYEAGDALPPVGARRAPPRGPAERRVKLNEFGPQPEAAGGNDSDAAPFAVTGLEDLPDVLASHRIAL